MVGRRDPGYRQCGHGMNQIAFGVGQDVALAPLDLLACIIAPWAAGFRGFHALAVDHASTGRSLAAHALSGQQQQGVVQRKPKIVVPPQIEPTPHRRDWLETGRQHPPGQAAP